MAKTKEDEVVEALASGKELTDDQMNKAREVMRKNLREGFDKWMEVYDEEPTDEDIQKCKDEFDAETKKWREQTYVLAEDHALEFAEMLRDWNANYNSWENGEWKGVVTFDKVIKEMIETYKADPTLKLEVNYETLMYLYKVMSNPKGKGLADAEAMAKFEDFDIEKLEKKDNDEYVTYSHILQEILTHVKFLMNLDKKLKLMRERINIEIAGIKFDWKITELEEFIQLHNAWVTKDLPEDQRITE